ncbi:E3 ubiquitin-protein ligase Siah1, partial [Fragariocoptes setiger]
MEITGSNEESPWCFITNDMSPDNRDSCAESLRDRDITEAIATRAGTLLNASSKMGSQMFGNATPEHCDIKSTIKPSISELTCLFECPVCFDHVTPPIIQCQNGHLVCKSCRNKITSCPTCRVPISSLTIRNLQLERLALTLLFPCKYNTSGCELKLTCSNKAEHEVDCEFRPYKCPCPGTACKWSGPVDQVMEHLTQQHKSITTLSGEDIVFLATDINLNGAVDWVMVQSCFDQHFLLVLEKQELKPGRQQFFAMVCLIGPQRLADNFSYRLELNGKRRRLQWEGTPRSICEGVQSIMSSYDCLVFDSKMTKHFSLPLQKEGVNLGINVTISRVVDSKPDLQTMCDRTR